MDASVVIGQQNFTSNTANDGQGSINKYGLSWPFGVYSDGTRLFVSDNVNNRVLIYNHIPISNHASADVVIGQQDFTHGDINQGGSAEANTLRVPAGILTIGNKLLISDVSL